MNHTATALHQIPQRAREWLIEFTASQATQITLTDRPGRTRRFWTAPPSNLVKINFDGAVFTFSEENKSGIGVVIRDSSGSVLVSCSKKIPHALMGSKAEALAAVTALSFATELGVDKAVLEGDSMEVIKALTQTERTLSSIGPWIDDSKVLASDFVQLQYSHIRR